jgi:hypothetical protein
VSYFRAPFSRTQDLEEDENLRRLVAKFGVPDKSRSRRGGIT